MLRTLCGLRDFQIDQSPFGRMLQQRQSQNSDQPSASGYEAQQNFPLHALRLTLLMTEGFNLQRGLWKRFAPQPQPRSEQDKPFAKTSNMFARKLGKLYTIGVLLF